MVKIALNLFMACFASHALAQASATNPTYQVGVAADSGFFANNQNGTLQGIDVEVLKLACQDLNWNCVFNATTFQSLLGETVGFEVVNDQVDATKPVTRKWDLAVGALDAKSARLQFMAFTAPYFSGRHEFFKMAGAASVPLQKRSGFPLPVSGQKMVIAIEKGSALENELYMVYGKMPRAEVEIHEYDNVDALKDLIASKSVNLVFTYAGSAEDTQSSALGLEKASGLLGVVDPSSVRGVAVGVSFKVKDAISTAQKLSQALQNLLKECTSNTDCRYQQVLKKNAPNLGFDPNPNFNPRENF